MSRRAAGLRAEDAEARLRAIAEVAAAAAERLDAEDLQALVDCLAFPSKSVQRPAAEACAALLAAGAPLRPLLVGALSRGDERLRWGAAYALGRAEDDPREALPAALAAFGSGDGDVRWAAAELVRRLARHHPEVVRDLVAAAAEEPAERRKMALYCLRDLQASDAEARGAAARALGDADEGVVLAALAAAARIAPADDAVVAAAMDLLASANPRLQRAAASALAHIGAGRADVDAALRRASLADDTSLRRAAEGALRRRV